MTQTKLLPNTAYQSGPLLSAREEAERFAVAAARVREHAQKDPAHAEQMLRDIGYYEMMEQQRLEEQEESQAAADGSHSNGSEDSVSSTVRGPFVEGDPIYQSAGINAFNHTQICVRDVSCILDYFRPIELTN